MSGTLIIGGTRFMGYFVVSKLLAAGEQVTILNRGKRPDPFGERVERLHADRTTPDFGNLLKGRDFDAVIDFSAYTARETQSAVDALQSRTGHYIFISSGAVYMVQEGATLPCTSGTFLVTVSKKAQPLAPQGVRAVEPVLYTG